MLPEPFALTGITMSLKYSLLELARHQTVWGFAIGFLASTGVHMVVLAEQPKDLPHLLRRDPSAAFLRIVTPSSEGAYAHSYMTFQREHRKIQTLFYSTLLVLLVIIVLAMLRV